ncbi:MAG: hypothetical protein GXO57_01670 [Thermodesulfobacteria bacterium]|nr:hypothetical protein [Thermodesulfobacteriota bacterium]
MFKEVNKGVVFVLSLIFVVFFFLLNSRALTLKKVLCYSYEGKPILSFYLGEFPFQLSVAAVKSGDSPIKVTYEVEVYKRRFLLPDIEEKKEVYEKELYYSKAENCFVGKLVTGDRAFIFKWFKPEKGVEFLTKLEGISLSIPNVCKVSRDCYFIVRVKVHFFCHLKRDLTVTSGKEEYEFRAEKSFDVPSR